MKILHLSAVKSWGGGERHIENLCAELAILSPDAQNSVFCIRHTDFHKRLKDKKIECITAPLGFKMDPRYFLKLAVVCRSKKFDLLHIHDSTALTLAIMADKLVDLPPFIFSKKTSFPIRTRKQTLYKYNYPKIKKILCVSKATLKTAAEKIENPGKLTTIYHGTSLRDKCTETPYDLREFLNLKPETILIGNIANHI
ncbi:MAG: glycosyltransferase, partial [Gillisia sp.]